MPYDVNIGIDHPFNTARRQHVQMLERTDRLAHRPEVFEYRSMIGGGPLREYALAGQNGAYPLDVVRLEEYKRMGGRFSLGRTLRQVKEAVPAAVRRKAYAAAKRVVRPAAERLAANYGLEEFVPVGERALDRAVGYGEMGGRFSLGRTLRQVKEAVPASLRRKAYSAAKRAVRPAAERLAANYGLEEFVPVGERALDRAVGGKINRLKKAKRWTGFAVDTVSKGLDLGSRAKHLFGYGEMEGYGARPDLPAGSKEAKDEMKRIREIQIANYIAKNNITDKEGPEATSFRKRFEKGSPEAKANMASIRKKRRTQAELDAERAADRAAAGLPPRVKRTNPRAAIVKKTMDKYKISMIEASKYVKANNLYPEQESESVSFTG